MENFEELEKDWMKGYSSQPRLDTKDVEIIIHRRRKKQVSRVMQYFWASFVYQLILYALLFHVIVRFWAESEIVVTAAAGLLILMPFTYMLMTKFKKLALPSRGSNVSEHIERQIRLVKTFFRFKKRYELFLIPVNTLIGIHLCIAIFTDGQLIDYAGISLVLFVITVLSCWYAIYRENQRNFVAPLKELETLKAECERGEG